MQRLQFLTGDFHGVMHFDLPGDLGSMEVQCHWVGSWEPCDRYLHINCFLHNTANKAQDSVHTLITYDEAAGHYLCHIYPSSSPERISLTGHFRGDILVFDGSPAKLIFGVEKTRNSYIPTSDGFELISERCEVTGWVPFSRCLFEAHEFAVQAHTRPLWPPPGFN